MKGVIHGYDEKGSPICCAINKKCRPCHNPAGRGTDHEGYGFCSFHDTTKDKVHPDYVIDTNKTFHELPIYVQLLPENIVKNWGSIKITTQHKLDEQIKLCDARIFILLQRIGRLEEIGEFIEVTEEEGHTDKDGNNMMIRRRKYAVEDAITRLEGEITKLQAIMMKAIDLRAKLDLLQTSEGDTGNIEGLVNAIRKSHTLVRTSEDVGVIRNV